MVNEWRQGKTQHSSHTQLEDKSGYKKRRSKSADPDADLNLQIYIWRPWE